MARRPRSNPESDVEVTPTLEPTMDEATPETPSPEAPSPEAPAEAPASVAPPPPKPAQPGPRMSLDRYISYLGRPPSHRGGLYAYAGKLKTQKMTLAQWNKVFENY